MEGRVLRPMGVGEILDAALNLYFRNFATLARIAVVIALPVALISTLLTLYGVAEVGSDNANSALYFVGDDIRLLDETRYVVTQVITGFLTVIGYLVVISAEFRSASRLYIGREATASESLRTGLRRLHSVVWISILLGLGLTLAFIALFLPFVWLLVAWSLAVPVLLAEDKRGSKALGRSFELIRDNWWRTFAALLVGFIFIALLQFLVQAGIDGLGSLAEDAVFLYVLLIFLGTGLVTVITAPLQAAIISVIYYDLRVRKEGFDVQLLTEQLEAPGADITGYTPPPPPPPTAPPPPDSPPPPSDPSKPPPPPAGW